MINTMNIKWSLHNISDWKSKWNDQTYTFLILGKFYLYHSLFQYINFFLKLISMQM